MLRRSDTFRSFPPCQKLSAYLALHEISYARLAFAGMTLTLPVADSTRTVLIDAVQRTPFEYPVSLYALSRYRNQSKPTESVAVLLGESLKWLGTDYAGFLEGAIAFNRLAFMMWVLSALDPTKSQAIYRDVAGALRQRFTYHIDAYRLSDWTNGHRYPSEDAQTLVARALMVILPGEIVTTGELFDPLPEGYEWEEHS